MIDNSPVFIRLEDVKGEKTGTSYTGEFKVKKYLNHKESTDATRLAEQLLRGIERSEERIAFLSTLAHLAFHIIEAPDWWGDNGLDLLDKEPVWVLAEKLSLVQQPPKEEKEEKETPKQG